jgi:hypothetical protein
MNTKPTFQNLKGRGLLGRPKHICQGFIKCIFAKGLKRVHWIQLAQDRANTMINIPVP